VDAVGGVDIEITDKEANYLKNYRISPSSTQPAINYGGTYHFSGHAAVIYMRIRKVKTISGSTQDVGRTERARTVLTTIADSLKDISYEDAVKLLEDNGVAVVLQPKVYQRYAVIDKSTLWYGGINFLGFEKVTHGAMRLCSAELAKELLDRCGTGQETQMRLAEI
jgi:hypothetical protein